MTALDASNHRVPNFADSVTLSSTTDTGFVNVVIPGTAFQYGEVRLQVTFTAVNAAANLTATDSTPTTALVQTATINVAAASTLPTPPWGLPWGPFSGGGFGGFFGQFGQRGRSREMT